MIQDKFKRSKEYIKNAAGEAVKTGIDLSLSAASSASELGKAAGSRISSSVAGAGVIAKEQGHKALIKALDALAEIPDGANSRTLDDMGLGGARLFAQARKEYHEALIKDDQEGITKAQLKAILSVQVAGVDLSLFAAKKLGLAAKIAARSSFLLSTSRIFSSLDKSKEAFTDYVSNKILLVPGVKEAVNKSFLTNSSPIQPVAN